MIQQMDIVMKKFQLCSMVAYILYKEMKITIYMFNSKKEGVSPFFFVFIYQIILIVVNNYTILKIINQ